MAEGGPELGIEFVIALLGHSGSPSWLVRSHTADLPLRIRSCASARLRVALCEWCLTRTLRASTEGYAQVLAERHRNLPKLGAWIVMGSVRF